VPGVTVPGRGTGVPPPVLVIRRSAASKRISAVAMGTDMTVAVAKIAELLLFIVVLGKGAGSVAFR